MLGYFVFICSIEEVEQREQRLYPLQMNNIGYYQMYVTVYFRENGRNVAIGTSFNWMVAYFCVQNFAFLSNGCDLIC